jgi:hypothetical protein
MYGFHYWYMEELAKDREMFDHKILAIKTRR